MKKHEVKLGGEYIVKVSGRLAHVRIDRENPHGGWDATNLATKKSVRIKSAQRLRAEAGRKATPAAHVATGAKPAAEPAKDAKPEPAAARGKPDVAGAKPVAANAKAAKPNPELDAAVKASEAERRAKKVKAAKPKGERKPGCLDAAAQVLAEAGEPLNCGEMMTRILKRGLWTTEGKTPAATLYSALLRDVRKGAASRFCKAAEGRFALSKTHQ
jgi:hypothetical protein